MVVGMTVAYRLSEHLTVSSLSSSSSSVRVAAALTAEEAESRWKHVCELSCTSSRPGHWSVRRNWTRTRRSYYMSSTLSSATTRSLARIITRLPPWQPCSGRSSRTAPHLRPRWNVGIDVAENLGDDWRNAIADLAHEYSKANPSSCKAELRA